MRSTCFSEYFLPVVADTQPRFIQFWIVEPSSPVSFESWERVSPPVASSTGEISENAEFLACSVYFIVVPGMSRFTSYTNLQT